jgi:hypothetical protein
VDVRVSGGGGVVWVGELGVALPAVHGDREGQHQQI